jgi:predicted RNA-binding Zn-ribbon protein involved in translation (DUF1610 family)
MTSLDVHVVRFQCPNCGHDLEQTIGQLKSSEHMRCPGCGVGINIDANRLATFRRKIGVCGIVGNWAEQSKARRGDRRACKLDGAVTA